MSGVVQSKIGRGTGTRNACTLTSIFCVLVESRVVILPAILRHLCFHISNCDDLIDKCLDALGSIVSILHDQESVMLSQLVLGCEGFRHQSWQLVGEGGREGEGEGSLLCLLMCRAG